MDGLMNTAPCGFVAFRDDGTIADINQTFCDLLGYSRPELASWHMEKILPPGGRIFYHTHVFPLLKMHGHVEEVYVAFRSKDGADVPMLMNGVRRERGGEMLSDCVCVRMIQRHQYEDQLLAARRLAEEANAAKAKFLSMMSHDLRTPLTTIYGHAGLLDAMHGELNAEQAEDVQIIREACRVLTRMIGDILDFAKLESGQSRMNIGTVSVDDAVARAQSLVRVQLSEARLTFAKSGCDATIAVSADADKLQQILLNLITNAIKFTPAGGSVAVTCDSEGDRVFIRVRDTGIGIAPEHLTRIFSPFVQLDQNAPARTDTTVTRGVGLGLAISRDLARAMNGDVTAESAPGAGSTFTITLPAARVSASV